jgi:hypothetical protein
MADVMAAIAAKEHTNLSFMGFALTPWITALILLSKLELSRAFRMDNPDVLALYPLCFLRTSVGQADLLVLLWIFGSHSGCG